MDDATVTTLTGEVRGRVDDGIHVFRGIRLRPRMYDGVRLCQRGDVVVVTLNHRLNLLGFCSLAELADVPMRDTNR